MCVFFFFSPVILIIVSVISVTTCRLGCVGLAYDMSLSQMIDNKVNSHLKGLINPYYYFYYYYYLYSTLQRL